jgi:hypothetical protein
MCRWIIENHPPPTLDISRAPVSVSQSRNTVSEDKLSLSQLKLADTEPLSHNLTETRSRYAASVNVPTSSPGEARSRRERQREVTDTSRILVISGNLKGGVRQKSRSKDQVTLIAQERRGDRFLGISWTFYKRCCHRRYGRLR